MATTEMEAPTERAGWLRRGWEKIATVLAVIGLVDVSGQLIKWAALIHWIATKYAAVRNWLFGWLPWHIPPEWHDPIVLFLIFLSVTNIGVYQKTGRTIPSIISSDAKDNSIERFLGELPVFIGIGSTAMVVISVYIGLFIFPVPHYGDYYGDFIDVLFYRAGVILFCVTFLSMCFIFGVVARRWVLTTAAIFGALVAVNYAYVQWLEPLAEH